jgi:hypothetical protein
MNVACACAPLRPVPRRSDPTATAVARTRLPQLKATTDQGANDRAYAQRMEAAAASAEGTLIKVQSTKAHGRRGRHRPLSVASAPQRERIGKATARLTARPTTCRSKAAPGDRPGLPEQVSCL